MEPQNNQVGSESAAPKASAQSLIAPLCKVTPLSKYLAAAVFIVMPFVGGLVGYTFALQRLPEPTPAVIIKHPEALDLKNTSTTSPLSKYMSGEGDWQEVTTYKAIGYVTRFDVTKKEIDIEFINQESYPEEEYQDGDREGRVSWDNKIINTEPPVTFPFTYALKIFDSRDNYKQQYSDYHVGDYFDENHVWYGPKSVFTFDSEGNLVAINEIFQP